MRCCYRGACAVLLALGLSGCGGAARKPQSVSSGLTEYIRQARSLEAENRQSEGSLWTDTSSLSGPYRDVKAYRLADIVTIQVLESTSALAAATTDSTKESESTADIPNLFGAQKKISELPSLLSANRSNKFAGDASTSRTNQLKTNVTARVVEVFPNGNLLVEGNREIGINNERQLVTLRGVVRPVDISPDNIVLSTNVAEMEIEVKGNGIVSRAQQPGLFYRLISQFWPF